MNQQRVIRLVRLLFSLLVIVACSLQLNARSLHVATTGLDSNPGTETARWQTIQHALEQALPGDTILVAGGIYREHIQSVRSGNEQAPIVLAACNHEPVILDGTEVDWSTGISLDHDYIELVGLEIRHWSSTGIWLAGAACIKIRDCHVHHCVYGIGAGDGAHDFLLEHVEISDFDLYGFDASPSGGTACYNGTLVDCTAHSARDHEQNVDGFALGHGEQQGFRFVRCESYGVFDGFDVSARDTTLVACSSHENGSAGFKIWADNVRLANCLSFDNGVCNLELDWDGEPGTTTLRNCTFVNAAVYSIWVENSHDRLDMVNCIVAGGDNIGLAFEQTAVPNYVGDYNLFHNDNMARAISIGYTHEFSLDALMSGAWTRYSGQDSNSIVTTTMTALFVAADVFDFHLSSSSPAVDAGLDSMAPETDITGTLRPWGLASDIGAWEELLTQPR